MNVTEEIERVEAALAEKGYVTEEVEIEVAHVEKGYRLKGGKCVQINHPDGPPFYLWVWKDRALFDWLEQEEYHPETQSATLIEWLFACIANMERVL